MHRAGRHRRRSELYRSRREDPRVTARARAFFEQLQTGKEDYTAMTPRLAQRLKSFASVYASEFAGYGKPTDVVFHNERDVAGQRRFAYVLHFGPGVELSFGLTVDNAGLIAGLSFG